MKTGFSRRAYKLWALAAALCLLGAVSCKHQESQADRVTVYAGAGTADAITDIARLFEEKSKVKVVLSFAAASTLAKQIEAGAPAQIFLSANPQWVDYLDERGLLEPGSRRDLLGNRLVLIAPRNSALSEVKIEKGFELDKLLGGGFLAMGDPDHVPVGMYGKEALENLGAWSGVEHRIARARTVREALVLVEREEAALGIVYITDAAVSDKVKVIGRFPKDCHAPITFQAAMVKGNASADAEKFLEYLSTPAAAEVFQKYGYIVR